MELSTQMVLTDTLVRRRLCQFTRIPFADSSLAEKVNDKSFLMKYAETMKIRKPKTYFPDGMEQVADIAHKLQYPVLIKPRASSGSRGIVYVNDEKDLPSSFAKVHKNYPSPIIQEYIPRGGGAFGVGLLLNFASEVKASFVYKRIREYPVQGGPSTLRESVQRQDIREIAESLLISLRWIGIAHVEFTIDPRDEKPKLLEVNPRFWGSLSLAIEAGVDFPYLLYRMAMEGDIDPVRDYRLGVQCRWLIPGDILHFIKNPNRFRLKPSFFDFSAKDDIISRHDFFPVIGRLSSALTFFFDKEMKELLKR